MSRSNHDQDPVHPGRYSLLIPLGLLIPLALFPPETRGESLAGCAILIALGALLAPATHRDARRYLPLLLLLVAAVPLARAATAPGAAVRPLAMVFLAGSVGLLTAAARGDWRQRPWLPLLVAGVATAVSLFALYQKFWGLEAWVRAIEEGLPVADRAAVLERARAGRAFAGFPTPAALGGYLALTLPVTVAFGFALRGARRAALLGLAGLQAAGLLVASSATAGAAILGALLLAAITRPALRRPVLLGIGAVALVLAGTVALRGSGVTGIDSRGSPWRLRASNYRLAASMAVDHPWLGVGPGGFGEVYPRYRRPGDNETRHAHNLPLELMAELGFPAGAAVSLLFFVLFAGPLLDRRVRGPTWWAGPQIGLAAFALHNLADFTAFLPSILWTAAILRGWLAREPRHSARPWPLPRAAAAAGAAVAAVLCVLIGLAWNDRVSARQAAAGEDWETAERRSRRAVRTAPWNVDGWLLVARGELETGSATGDRVATLAAALAAIERGLAAVPVRPAARDFRARLRLALGDAPGAFADASAAARLYPMAKEYRELRDRLAAQVRTAEPVSGSER